jgi:hypothetical protein
MNGAHAKLRQENKKWAIALLGGKCVICETTDNLEFDHIIYSTKSFTIGACLTNTREVLTKELEKCQLLCTNCHREKNKTELHSGFYKLDYETAEEIRGFLQIGLTPIQIAHMYDVSAQTIRKIRRGTAWKQQSVQHQPSP